MATMNKTILKWGIIVVLSVIALWLVVRNRTGTLRREIAEFSMDDTASVVRIFLADMKGNTVLLKKLEPGRWLLNDSLPVRSDAIKTLLSTMYRMTVQSPVPRASYNTVIANLATNSVKVEVYEKSPRFRIFGQEFFVRERLSKVYFVGQATPDNLGTYMMMEGSETPFIVYLPGLRGFISPRFSANPDDWRDHTIFSKKPKEIRSIQIEFPGQPEESYRIEISAQSAVTLRRLIDGAEVREINRERLISFVNGFRNIRYEAMVDRIKAPVNIDSILSSVPLHIITLTDTTGKVQRVRTFRRPNLAGSLDDEGKPYPYDIDRLYAELNNGKDFVLIQYFVFDPITRPLSYFRLNQ